MKAAAAQADAVELGLLANFFGEFDEDRGETRVETAADVGNRFLSADVAQDFLEERQGTNLPVGPIGNQIERVGAIVGGIVRGHFQFDRGLSFVVDSGTNAGEGSNRVE